MGNGVSIQDQQNANFPAEVDLAGAAGSKMWVDLTLLNEIYIYKWYDHHFCPNHDKKSKSFEVFFNKLIKKYTNDFQTVAGNTGGLEYR